MRFFESGAFWRVVPVPAALLACACSSPDLQKQKHFERGIQYAAEKRDDFAVIEFANAVRLDPKFGKARWQLAESYERMNNLRAAYPEFIRAADALPDDRDAQIKATQILLIARRFDDAKARASAMLAKNPMDVDALLLRANAMAGLNDSSGAIGEIEEALKIQPNESFAFVNLGAVRMRSGEAAEAEVAFRRAVSLEPQSINARLALGNYLWAVGRQAEAEQEIRQAISIEPRHLLANRMLGALYVSTKRIAEAEQPLKVVAEISKNPAARFRLAEYYVAAKRTDDAIKLLTQLATDPAAAADAEAALGSIDYDAGRRKEAHARIDALLVKTPKDARALVMKARWLSAEDKLDEALDRAKAAVSGDPQSANAQYTLGAVHALRREVPDATKAYEEALRLNPRAVAAQVELSRLNLVSGNREAAVHFAEEAKQIAPANVAARIALARSLLVQGDLARAQAEVAELQRGVPNSADVETLVGQYHARRNDPASARKSYERALALSPGDVNAVAGLVTLDMQQRQLDAALNRVEAELAKQPNRVELLTLAAQTYDQAGRSDKAEQALRRAIAAEPRSQQAYMMLARVFVKQRRLDDARAEFEAIVKRDPRGVEARTMVGIILEVQGKRDEAKRWYEATVAAISNAPLVANNLAVIYTEEGTNLEVALQLATSAKQQMPDSPEIDDTLGWVYYRKDLAALAIGPLEASLKKLPGNPDVLYHLGLAYAKVGEKEKARDALAQALKLNPGLSGADTARRTLVSVSQ